MKFPSSFTCLGVRSRVGPRARRRSVIALVAIVRECLCLRWCGASRQAAPGRGSWWSGRRCAPTALRCSALWPRRTTRFVRCAHCARTSCGESVYEARLRADPVLALQAAPGQARPFARHKRSTGPFVPCHLLAAPQIAPAGYRLPRRPPGVALQREPPPLPQRRRPGRWQRACGAPRSTGLVAGARSAPRNLTCRTLSERSERSERSELCDGPQGRAPQGSRCAAPTAPPEALPPARARLCSAIVGREGIRLFGDRSQASDCTALRLMRRGSGSIATSWGH